MGILVSSEHFEHEITEDGELLFLDYNISYDETIEALGGKKSAALEYLEQWNKEPIPKFLALLGKFSREQAVFIAKVWLETIVKISGVKKIDTTDIGKFIEKADRAITTQDGILIGYLNNEAGIFAAESQQQKWMMSPPYGSPRGSYFDRRISPKLAVANALIAYLQVGTCIRCVDSFWYDHGGIYHAFRHMSDLAANAASDFIEATELVQDWVPWSLPIPASHISSFKKYLVGQAVIALVKVSEKP